MLFRSSGAALTVMLATVTGFPISTTHALTGALAGAGFAAAGPQFNPSVLGAAFFLPLLVSPMIALLLAMPLYKLAHIAVQRGGLRRDTVVVAAPQNVNMSYLLAPAEAGVRVSAYEGRLLGLSASALVDGLHYLRLPERHCRQFCARAQRHP